MTSGHRCAQRCLTRLIVAALGSSFAAASGAPSPPPLSLPSPPLVGTCEDSLRPGTLRQALAQAGTGTRIDLSQLQCSLITLSDSLGELAVNVDDLTITGAASRLAIDAGHHSRVFRHNGHNGLHLENLDLRAGHTTQGKGGCIYSSGYVSLIHTTVNDCVAEADDANATAKGGGIYSYGGTDLLSSTITGTTARNLHGPARGGAVDAAFVDMEPAVRSPARAGSTIDSSSVDGTSATGGAIHARLFTRVYYSTISHCSALDAAAIDNDVGVGFFIANSTISGNTATGAASVGAIASRSAGLIYNTTLAFNHGEQFGNLRVDDTTASTFITSSIFAYSRNAMEQPVPDIAVPAMRFGGFANLVMNPGSAQLPPDTLVAAPLLSPLGDFGGATLTHVLLPGSPALGKGKNPLGFSTDQRGQLRADAAAVDVGAVQITQPTDDIFSDDFDVSS